MAPLVAVLPLVVDVPVVDAPVATVGGDTVGGTVGAVLSWPPLHAPTTTSATARAAMRRREPHVSRAVRIRDTIGAA